MEKERSQNNNVGCKPLTTFVQTDTTTFREVVQRLTGPSFESHTPLPLKAVGSKRPTTTSKLHERRHLTRPKLQIVKPCPSYFKPTTSISAEHPSFLLSPVGTPSKILSKLSIEDGEKELNNMEEEKAIKERRFYLHPSPRSMPGCVQPELLSLFPLESPTSSQEP